MTGLPQRKSPRLPGYDYATAGAYFVTICTHQRQHHFGQIEDAAMQMTALGQIVQSIWHSIPDVFPSVALEDFVVMPNHVHGILYFTDENPVERPQLGTVVNNFKGTVTRTAKRQLSALSLPIWQTRYHDHIIRNDADLERIRLYVQHNVARWQDDKFYSAS